MRSGGGALGALVVSVVLVGSAGSENLDGRGKPLQDPFLDRLAGEWTVSRRMRGQDSTSAITAEWVLQHQFLRLHLRDLAEPSQYEALVLIGYSHADERYVIHWCDNFGGRFSAIGYGKRAGNAIPFLFQYPEGPFHNTFTWHPDTHSWTSLMESEGPDGKRSFFAEDTYRKGGASPRP